MNTLVEIEAAVEALPSEQKQELLLFLAARLRAEGCLPELRQFSAGEISFYIPEDKADFRGVGDDEYKRGYTQAPEDISLTNAMIPQLAVDLEKWE